MNGLLAWAGRYTPANVVNNLVILKSSRAHVLGGWLETMVGGFEGMCGQVENAEPCWRAGCKHGSWPSEEKQNTAWAPESLPSGHLHTVQAQDRRVTGGLLTASV